MSLEVINQDHYAIGVFYAPGNYSLDKNTVGTC